MVERVVAVVVVEAEVVVVELIKDNTNIIKNEVIEE